MVCLVGDALQPQRADELLDLCQGVEHRRVLTVTGLDGGEQLGVRPLAYHHGLETQLRNVPLGLRQLDAVLQGLDASHVALHSRVHGQRDKRQEVLHLDVHDYPLLMIRSVFVRLSTLTEYFV